MDQITRFWAKVDISAGPYGCWIWTASRQRSGHGKFGRTMAHRWIIQHLAGRTLSSDEWVCHKCDNPPCCNPTHLYIGSMIQNIRDREERGRSGSGKLNAAKTHCPRGHEYSGENTFIKNGSRNCRMCHRDRERQRRIVIRGGV